MMPLSRAAWPRAVDEKRGRRFVSCAAAAPLRRRIFAPCPRKIPTQDDGVFMRAWVATMMLAGCAGVSARAADACRPDAGAGEAVVVDGATADGLVRLRDGRLVRLAGLERLPAGVPLPPGSEATLLPAENADRDGA